MVKTNSIKAWLLAARPKTLTGAAVPVMIGAALAWKDAQSDFQWIPALLCFLFAFVMQIDANFVNDYFDFKHGNDDETRLGPKRACAEGWITLSAMKRGLLFTTGLGCLIGLPLILYGGWEMVVVGILCVAFCFLYTTKLSYLGLGDLLVLIFFGIVPVCCTYYVILPPTLQTVTWQVFAASIASGLVIDTLLIVNNYRDRDNDKAAGKMTLVVKIGAKNTEWLYLTLGIVATLIMLILSIVNELPESIPVSAIPLYCGYVAIHLITFRKMKKIRQGKELNIILGETARNMFIFGLICTVVICLEKTLAIA